jgi:hypothetical protein
MGDKMDILPCSTNRHPCRRRSVRPSCPRCVIVDQRDRHAELHSVANELGRIDDVGAAEFVLELRDTAPATKLALFAFKYSGAGQRLNLQRNLYNGLTRTELVILNLSNMPIPVCKILCKVVPPCKQEFLRHANRAHSLD